MLTDVAIVGAGVSGCIAAIALAPACRVLLIDKAAEPAVRIGECLPPAARRILERLDLLDGFDQQPHLSAQGMQSYWGSERPRIADSLRNPDGLGWFLDRRAFEVFLRQAARSRGVDTLWPVRILHSRFHGNHWSLATDTQQAINAAFVIDAGGRQAPFARRLGIERQALDRLIACWAAFPSRGLSQLGLIAAEEAGWWYSAPLPAHRRVISLQTDADLFDTATARQLPALLQRARHCAPVARLLGNTIADSVLHHGIRSANSTRLTQVAGAHWAAVGDAAISFDPLSSQGMFNAMATAMQLADLLQKQTDVKSAYTAQVQRIWQHYLRHRTHHYRQESRWPASSFWQRRH